MPVSFQNGNRSFPSDYVLWDASPWLLHTACSLYFKPPGPSLWASSNSGCNDFMQCISKTASFLLEEKVFWQVCSGTHRETHATGLLRRQTGECSAQNPGLFPRKSQGLEVKGQSSDPAWPLARWVSLAKQEAPSCWAVVFSLNRLHGKEHHSPQLRRLSPKAKWAASWLLIHPVPSHRLLTTLMWIHFLISSLKFFHKLHCSIRKTRASLIPSHGSRLNLSLDITRKVQPSQSHVTCL